MMKVAMRSELARRWHDLIDQEVERIVARELNVEQAGRELFAEQHRRHAGGASWHNRLGGMKAAIHDRLLKAETTSSKPPPTAATRFGTD